MYCSIIQDAENGIFKKLEDMIRSHPESRYQTFRQVLARKCELLTTLFPQYNTI